MSLLISGDLRLRNQLPADTEADAYIAAVEAADGQALEPGVKFAIKNFVLCCKQDGIWDAIKASCILSGARTLAGALVPLVGTAPTNNGFIGIGTDYVRKTGLIGNGSTKYLDSNRNNNTDPQDSNHNSIFISTAGTGIEIYAGAGVGSTESGVSNLGRTTAPSVNTFFRNRYSASLHFGNADATGFVGTSRSSSANFLARVGGQVSTATLGSQSPYNGNWCVFAGTGGSYKSNARLAFYSIGESLDLALLDARVTDLINAFAAAIP